MNTLLALIALAFYAGVAQWLNRPGESGVDLGLVGDTDMAAVVQDHRWLLPALIAVLTLLWLFVGRFALYLGARSTEKHGEKQAANAARRSR
ncbi:hypothetical protein [Aureimonas sp. AU20]|uniref:hypothetical protein n=1 Tax=Aureimonas sp. AU20 TaxID=1349819 RepID=UPI000721AE2E|nr:hypothetical protein [Aureimonas sp. AU20]ALN72567.1 hypothetical protein M673_07560 [Aureimonas sp. AU20]